jgi:2-polyprenyl-3-methyl-5-hydroxy-6-metoxy-1,4-benzoquinol methylase
MVDKQNDTYGTITLDAISEADKFNHWMYSTIKPFCNGKVLEIGSGIGNISSFFLKDNYNIFLSDIRIDYCVQLEEKFNGYIGFLGAQVIDLTDPDFEEKYRYHLRKYDTVFALNVIEHIYNDTLALENCYKLLTKNGTVIILVPSYQKLFNHFDTELGHYRRYTKSSLSKIFLSTNFEILHKQYFNFAGILGWFISGNVLNKKEIPKSQMRIYNALVPIFKIVDKLTFNTIGLSTIIIGKK